MGVGVREVVGGAGREEAACRSTLGGFQVAAVDRLAAKAAAGAEAVWKAAAGVLGAGSQDWAFWCTFP